MSSGRDILNPQCALRVKQLQDIVTTLFASRKLDGHQSPRPDPGEELGVRGDPHPEPCFGN